MVGPWKQCSRGSYISQRFPWMFKTRTTLPAPHSSKQGPGSGPFGAEHPSANHVLFYVGGRSFLRLYILLMSHLGKLGVWLYHHRILQRPYRKSLRGAGWLSSDTRRKQSGDQMFGIRQDGAARNGSRNEHRHATKHILTGQQEEMSPVPPPTFAHQYNRRLERVESIPEYSCTNR